MLAFLVSRFGMRRDERGASAVEFSFIVFPFLILLFGMIQFSFYFFSGQSGATAAREAARRAAVGDQSCSALTTATTNATKLKSTTPTVTRKYYAPSVNPITDTSPTRAANAIKVGDNVRVVLTYKVVDMHFPLVPMPGNNGVRAQVRETAVARVETVTSNTVAC